MAADRRYTRTAPPRGRYACAEDLCDAFEESENEDARPQRPRKHALRLVDELGETHAQPDAMHAARETRRAERSMHSAESPAGRAERLPEAPREVGAFGASDEAEASEEAYAVLSVRPGGEGETVAVTLSLPEGTVARLSDRTDRRPVSESRKADGLYDKTDRRAAREQVRLYLLVEQYAALAPRAGSITPEAAEALIAAGRLCAAVKRGMYLLGYGDRSARRLAFKLTAKGVDRAVAEEAVAYLVDQGYIREDDTARLRAAQDVRKLWGPRRIREDLRANGFSPDAVEEAMESLAEVDFEENCATLIRKKHRGVPADRAGRQKLTAALLRLGYDGDVVRRAMQAVLREESAAESGDGDDPDAD